ncbi:MAG: hypothetical protein WA666_09600 [Nitrospirota bacterium]
MENCGDKIRCSRVEISGATICEVCGIKTVVTVPREHIRRISVVYDTTAKYPFFQFFMGFVLIALGVIGLTVSWLASTVIGPIDIDPDNMNIPIIPVVLWLMIVSGVWSLVVVFRASYHMLIETEDGVKKIFFEKATTLPDIQHFIRRAGWRFGYEIDTSSLDKLEQPTPAQ